MKETRRVRLVLWTLRVEHPDKIKDTSSPSLHVIDGFPKKRVTVPSIWRGNGDWQKDALRIFRLQRKQCPEFYLKKSLIERALGAELVLRKVVYSHVFCSARIR